MQQIQPCSHCGHENRTGRGFCGNCGARLTITCLSCGTANPAANRFCEQCGTALVASESGDRVEATEPGPKPEQRTATSSEVDKERRVVTILFADLVGSTSLGETHDAETVEEVIHQTQAELAGAVDAFGGRVSKYLGDGVMAIFGAPVAKEDDAECAVLAALRMQERLRSASARVHPDIPALEMRIGITSGEVIAGLMPGGYDVIGDAANTAARLQSAAEVGGVLVDAATMRRASRRVLFGERQELSLKGKSGAVEAYAALGIRDRPVRRWENQAEQSTFIGRKRELETISGAWSRVLSGTGQLVAVVGEAGIGKSRIVLEALARLSNPGRTIEVQGLSYATQLNYSLLADILRGVCGIMPSDGAKKAKPMLAVALEGALPDEQTSQRDAGLDVLGEVLGMPESPSIVQHAPPQVRRQVLVRMVRALVRSLARGGAAIVVIEDFHWSDVASIQVLTDVLVDLPGLRVLMLVTARSDWVAPWSAWDWPERLQVRALAEEEAATLSTQLIGGESLPPTIQSWLFEQAGGNPLFLEELLRSLNETEGLVRSNGEMRLDEDARERIPGTLTELLLSRLDRLDRDVRKLAQAGSVVGRTFAVRLLARLLQRDAIALEDPLRTLQHAEIAFPHWGAEEEYVFRHAMIRQTAYNTLLLRHRQQIHAATAHAMIELYGEQEHCDLIAYHFERSSEHAEAARWLERAGDRAAAVSANGAALEAYKAAGERAERTNLGATTTARLDGKTGHVLRITGQYDAALQTLERARLAFQTVADSNGERGIVAEMVRAHALRGTTKEGEAIAKRFAAGPPDDNPNSSVAALQAAMAELLYAQGKYHDQLNWAERLTTTARALGDEGMLAEALATRGTALFRLDRVKEGVASWEEAIPLAERSGVAHVLATLLENIGLYHLAAGQFEASKSLRKRALELATLLGNPLRTALACAGLGEVAFYQGDWATARERHTEASLGLQNVGAGGVSAYPHLLLGQLACQQGRWEEAASSLDTAIQLARTSNDVQMLQWGCCLLAELDLLNGHRTEAMRRFDGLFGGSILTQVDVTYLLPTYAAAALAAGQIEEATSICKEAIRRAESENDVVDLIDALRVSAEVANEKKDSESAHDFISHSLTLSRSIGYPLAIVRALLTVSRIAQSTDDEETAHRSRNESLALADRIGAQAYLPADAVNADGPREYTE